MALISGVSFRKKKKKVYFQRDVLLSRYAGCKWGAIRGESNFGFLSSFKIHRQTKNTTQQSVVTWSRSSNVGHDSKQRKKQPN